MLDNLINVITEIYHAITPKRLPRYLVECCYRFNHRFQLEDMLPCFTILLSKEPPLNNSRN